MAKKQIDKEKAIELRQSGLSYPEISKTMGCSVDWCKHNLKGIGEQSKDKPIIQEIRRLGRLETGVTSGEIKDLVKQAYPDLYGDELQAKITEIKKASRRGNKDVIIRPYWMVAECPHECITTIMDMAQEVYYTMHYLGTKYRKLYDLPESYQKSIVYALSMLSAGENNKLMPQGLLEYGAYLEGVADTLSERYGE